MVVEYKDLIKGEIYDLQIRAYERREEFNHNNVYVEVRPTIEFLNNMAFVGFTYTNRFLIFKKHLDMTYVIKHPENKVYNRKTIGEILSTTNPDKKQSSATINALTKSVFDNLPDGVKRVIKSYGGKKKSKRKTKKRTKLTKRIRKLPSKKQRGGETNEELTKSLYNAITDNKVNKVNDAITSGVDVNVVYGTKSAIELASHDGKLAIVKILLATGANVNRKLSGILSHPALTWASVKGHTEIVKLLLEADANPLAVSYGNITAIKLASNNGHKEIVRLINNRIRSNNYLTANLVTKLLPRANNDVSYIIASHLNPKGGKRIRKSNESKRYRRKTTKKRRSKKQSRKY
jgi:uncharacterized protein